MASVNERGGRTALPIVIEKGQPLIFRAYKAGDRLEKGIWNIPIPAEGDPVLLFGEGTSSDGNRVLAFRTALIGAARDAMADAEHVKRVWIQPLSIAYTGLLGVPLGRQNRNMVAWYGGSSLWPHLRRLVARGAIDVTVTWGEPIAYDEFSDRKTVARRLEDEVRTLTVAALRGRALSPSLTS